MVYVDLTVKEEQQETQDQLVYQVNLEHEETKELRESQEKLEFLDQKVYQEIRGHKENRDHKV